MDLIKQLRALTDDILGLRQTLQKSQPIPTREYKFAIYHLEALLLDLRSNSKQGPNVAEMKGGLDRELAALNRLHELSTTLLKDSRDKDVAFNLRQVLLASIELLGADKGNIQLYDERAQALKIVTHVGFDQTFLDLFKSVPSGGNCACGKVLAGKERVIVEDFRTDPRFTDFGPICAAHDFVAVQSTPLFGSDDRLYGILSTHFRQPHRPSQRELYLLDCYAGLAEQVIECKPLS